MPQPLPPRQGPLVTRAQIVQLAVSCAGSRSRDAAVFIPVDANRCGSLCVVVERTTDPDSFLDALEYVVPRFVPAGLDNLFVVTIRPNLPTDPGDVDRWFEAADAVAAYGGQLFDWLVVSNRGVSAVGDVALGLPPDPLPDDASVVAAAPCAASARSCWGRRRR